MTSLALTSNVDLESHDSLDEDANYITEKYPDGNGNSYYRERSRVCTDSLSTPKFSPCLADSLSRLIQFRNLKQNWDSYGAGHVSSIAIESAITMLYSIQEELYSSIDDRIVPMCVAPLDHGGVQMEWSGSRAEIEVEIGPDASLSYLLIRGSGIGRVFEELNQATLEDTLNKVFYTLLA